MKINAVITTKSIRPYFDKEESSHTLFSVMPIAFGMMLGCVFYLVFGKRIDADLLELFINFSVNFAGKTSLEIFSGILISDFSLVLFIYLFGSSVRGRIPIFALSFFKAFGLSLVATYLFCTHALKGIEYCLLVFFPGKAVFLLALLLVTENSLAMSLELSKSLKLNNGSKIDLSKYDLRTLVILLIVVLADLVEFIMIESFSSLFAFA